MTKPKTAMAISNPFSACSDQDNDGATTSAPAGSYTYLGGEDPEDGRVVPTRGQTMKPKLVVVFEVLMFLIMAALLATIGMVSRRDSPETVAPLLPRGFSEGVSAKSRGPHLGVPSFPWTKRMLDWQRTGFHFQPEKNWMNDPNGPLYYKGWYHFFYQYNPEGPVWGNIIWGHAVSRDLIHWRHLPAALTMDKWYDINGVWTGSTTILPDGQVIVLYTGATNETAQVQNLAYPRDLSDPLLIDWVKYSGNPVIVPPPGVRDHDFRDPTTAWLTSGGKWRIAIGSKVNKTGIALVYETKDFKKFDLLDGVLHAVPGTGMWECVDFYPVSETEERGLDTSTKVAGVKHVVKTSLDEDQHDYYWIGRYDEESDKWFPDEEKIDVGIGLRYDYGPLYASKTFYDQNKKRRILWGWVPETDSERADINKGWASVQAVPRTILLDNKTGSNLLQWPVKEVENLRSKKWEFNNVAIKPGSTVHLDVGAASQLDISAEFEIEEEALERINGSDMVYNCRHTGGAAKRGALGPFGVIVLAHNSLSEQTPVYFYVIKRKDGNLKTFFCNDKSRSSEATNVRKSIYGSTVTVLKDEKLSMRVLVDHSIVESFGQGGRTCITSRVYPTKAIYGDAKVFLFNNATEANITASLEIWQLDSAYIHSYPTELIMFIVLCWLLTILCWFFVRPNIPCSVLIFC